MAVKQVLQHVRTGVLDLADIPCPQVQPGHLLVQSRASLISTGTERMLVEFSKSSLISKARQQPERVQQVLDKIKSDGLLPTLEAVFNKLDEPLPLGYCNAGVVTEVGAGVLGYAVGDRVASNGSHAEMVVVPAHLCARVPDPVNDDHASFAVIGSIGMQGIRLLGTSLGETVAVFGLGLVGLLTVQMLIASGVKVVGIDPDADRLRLAEQFGASVANNASGTDPVSTALQLTGGNGVDGVLITASAKNDNIAHSAAQMSRKRGRIVLVGTVNTELKRADFYEKELSFQVSCSYGPGRYDPAYEEKGHDYPLAYVRWTEQRNIESVLQLIASGRVDVEPLISRRFPHSDASAAYDVLTKDRSQIGILLQYPRTTAPTTRVVSAPGNSTVTTIGPTDRVVAGIIGAGGFTTSVLLPALSLTPAVLKSVASARGIHSAHAATKFGAATSTSDYRTIIEDQDINTVFITTRHNQHVPMVCEVLAAGKHVFVEKPLALDLAGLDAVREAYEKAHDQHLMVGFNRRFSPHARKIRELLSTCSEPACMVMTVNAGKIPTDHWVHDPTVGGGRVIGEGCHWIDLMSFLVCSRVSSVQAASIGSDTGIVTRGDHISVSLVFANGSLGTLHYFANGHRAFPKERLDVFCQGRSLHLENFRKLSGHGWANFRKRNLFRQDKGHRAEIAEFVAAVRHGSPPLIPFAQLYNTTAASFMAMKSEKTGQREQVE